MVMKMRPNAPSKLTGTIDRSRLTEPFAAAVTFSEVGYRPEYLDVRGEIEDDMVIARITFEALDQLEADPKVVSVMAGRTARPASPTD